MSRLYVSSSHRLGALFNVIAKPRDRGGQGLIEYALIMLLVAVAAIFGVTAFGAGVLTLFQTILSRWP